MPELPEVETIRRDLENHLIGQAITAVDIRLPKIVRTPADLFRRTLLLRQVKAIRRRGKLLMIALEGTDFTLLFHLKMTGQLLFQSQAPLVAGGHPWPAFNTPLPNKYTHLIIEFGPGGTLFFNDLRQFGFAQLVTPTELEAVLRGFGIEPLTPNFTLDNFEQAIKKRTGPVKGFLLNQQLVSGLGNIYADEVCWQSRVKPDRRLNTLTRAEAKRLFLSCLSILSEAIELRGTTFRDYRDAQGQQGGYAAKLKVYGRAGSACPRCGTAIEKIRLVGRGTHFCPGCQS